MKRTYMTFFANFYEQLKNLPNEQKGVIFSAIFEYSFYQNLPDLEGVNAAIFGLIKPTLDRGNALYLNGLQAKKKANPKQTRSKPEANPKQTGARNKKDILPIGNISEIEKEATVVASKKTDAAIDFNFDFIAPGYEAFLTWMEYRQSSEKPYRNQMSAEAAYRELIRAANASNMAFSDYIDMAIANQWTYPIVVQKTVAQANITYKEGDVIPSGVRLGVGERIENEMRTYGRGIKSVPMDAPPRPSDDMYWNERTGLWTSAC
ncbi:MAG: DUF6291 domain-containing protein [Bacteroidales bacterium]|jgi:hypothetical protein|nr:DUF6291 domain-containing protein [Bacteroidales bacterium]